MGTPTNTKTEITLRLYNKQEDISLPSKSAIRGSEQKSYILKFRFISSGQQILAHFTTQTTNPRSFISPRAQIAPT